MCCCGRAGDGPYTLTVRARDGACNLATNTSSAATVLDTTNPQVSVVAEGVSSESALGGNPASVLTTPSTVVTVTVDDTTECNCWFVCVCIVPTTVHSCGCLVHCFSFSFFFLLSFWSFVGPAILVWVLQCVLCVGWLVGFAARDPVVAYFRYNQMSSASTGGLCGESSANDEVPLITNQPGTPVADRVTEASLNLSPLSEGMHQLHVWCIDAVQHRNPTMTVSWGVDTKGPVVPLVVGPSDITTDVRRRVFL